MNSCPSSKLTLKCSIVYTHSLSLFLSHVLSVPPRPSMTPQTNIHFTIVHPLILHQTLFGLMLLWIIFNLIQTWLDQEKGLVICSIIVLFIFKCLLAFKDHTCFTSQQMFHTTPFALPFKSISTLHHQCS